MSTILVDPSLVPFLKLEDLVKIILEKFLIQYEIQIDQALVTADYILPREQFEDCIKLTYNVPNEPAVSIGCYIRYSPDYSFIINDFKQEFVKDIIEITPPPQTDPGDPEQPLPDLPPPPVNPPSTIPIVEFNPKNYTVLSGNSVILNVVISNAPTLIATVGGLNQDGTAIEGLSYSFTPGTVNWDPGDGSPKGILVQTGTLFYYYWRNIGYYLINSSNSIVNNSLLTLDLTNISNNVLYAEFNSSIVLPPEFSFTYHEFEYSNQNFINYSTLILQTRDTSPIFGSVTTMNGILINTDIGTGNTIIGIIGSNGTNSDIGFPYTLTKPFRIGFLVDDFFGAKVNINGYWIDLNNEFISQNVDDVSFSNSIVFDPTTVSGKFLLYTELAPTNDPSDQFILTAKIDDDQLYRPFNISSVKPRFRTNDSIGTFTVSLVDSVNNTIGDPLANIDILDGYICYSKLIVNNDLTGFVGVDISESVNFSSPPKFIGKIDWIKSSATCGNVIDTRLTAARAQPYQQSN